MHTFRRHPPLGTTYVLPCQAWPRGNFHVVNALVLPSCLFRILLPKRWYPLQYAIEALLNRTRVRRTSSSRRLVVGLPLTTIPFSFFMRVSIYTRTFSKVLQGAYMPAAQISAHGDGLSKTVAYSTVPFETKNERTIHKR